MFYTFLIFLILILLLIGIINYSNILILWVLVAIVVLCFMIYLSCYTCNYVIFGITLLFLIILLPTIYFYLDLCSGIYPYLYQKKNKQKEMKTYCQKFLKRHFNVIEINKQVTNKCQPVIYVVNHHTVESRILDHFGILNIPGKNHIVVTGGKTRWKIIDNLYSNLHTVKLSKESRGNLEVFLKGCKEVINRGDNLIIFPEGKHSSQKTSWRKLKELQSGAFILSTKLNIPIIPVIISGNNHQYGFITNKNLTIQYIDPIYPNKYNSSEDMKNYCLDKMNKKLKYL